MVKFSKMDEPIWEMLFIILIYVMVNLGGAEK